MQHFSSFKVDVSGSWCLGVAAKLYNTPRRSEERHCNVMRLPHIQLDFDSAEIKYAVLNEHFAFVKTTCHGCDSPLPVYIF